MREEREARRAKLALLAARQHGVVAYRQLVRLGFDRGEIDRLVASAFLHRLFKGVFAVGHAGVSREAEFMAAVLAFGREAVLSHWTAASTGGC